MKAQLAKSVCLLLLSYQVSGCASWNYLVGERDYPMPDGSLAGSVICGQPICSAGQNGARFDFIKNPWSPSVDGSTTPIAVAVQVVGHTSNNPYGRDPFTCSTKSGISPFAVSDVKTLGSSEGRSVTYSKNEVLDINVTAAVDADLDALTKSGLLQAGTNISELKAKLTSVYSSLDQSTVSVTARYFEFGLTGEAYRDVFEREKYSECSERLRAGSEGLITAVGIVWFDLTYDSSSATELIAKVQADLESSGIHFNFGGSVRKKVSEKLKATTKNGFQVITWTTADRSHFRDP